MGRPKKPAIIKLAEGDRGHRGAAKIGVDLQARGKPVIPPGLNEEARGMWREIIDNLPNNLLARVDTGILERHCIAWARYRDCQRKIEKTGLLVQSPQGPIRNPLLVTQNQAAKEMHSTGGELGLSPVARARLNEPAAPGTDPMDYLMGMNEGDDWMPPAMDRRN